MDILKQIELERQQLKAECAMQKAKRKVRKRYPKRNPNTLGVRTTPKIRQVLEQALTAFIEGRLTKDEAWHQVELAALVDPRAYTDEERQQQMRHIRGHWQDELMRRATKVELRSTGGL